MTHLTCWRFPVAGKDFGFLGLFLAQASFLPRFSRSHLYKPCPVWKQARLLLLIRWHFPFIYLECSTKWIGIVSPLCSWSNWGIEVWSSVPRSCLRAGGRSRSCSRHQDAVLVSSMQEVMIGWRQFCVVLGLLVLRLQDECIAWKADLRVRRCGWT